jgi:hypothetical protein
MDVNDELMTVRNILHTNMLLCLILVQILFLFGIDQTKNKVKIDEYFFFSKFNFWSLD